MKLTLKEVRDEIGDVKTFVFAPSEPVSWQPGQFIHYTLAHDNADDRGDERWFTISSAPYEGNIWITTRIFDKPSSFKHYLTSLEVGQTIETDIPEGDFVAEDETQQYIFVAGGIGITPFHSIITALHQAGKDFKIELLYANRDDEHVLFRDELEAIAKQHPDFNIRYFIGDNRIDEATLEAYKTKFENPFFYVSGPEPMTEAFEATLKKLGVDAEHLQLDFFPGYKAE